MKRNSLSRIAVVPLSLCALFICAGNAAVGADEKTERLWTIGQDDDGNSEFALAPRGYAEFKQDGYFIVGTSDARQDWPYVHPGPGDGWAGERNHTFGIAFALEAVPSPGSCRLVLDLLDTHNAIPPQINVEINGQAFQRTTPPGAGDASIFGDPTKGREQKLELEFPSSLLKVGTNHIDITTLSGSWIMYDWLGLDVPAGARLGTAKGTVIRSVTRMPTLVERGDVLMQTVRVVVLHFGDPCRAVFRITDADPLEQTLEPGQTTVDIPVPRVDADKQVTVTVNVEQQTLAEYQLLLNPVRKWVVYLLPHSHVDIGYTHVQTDVEQSHWQYYRQAIAASRNTADYPAGAQFKWNAEVLWATDSYLKQATPEERDEFMEAVKNGWIGLDALYGNELTGLCRPEELVQLVDYGNRLKRQYGVTIDSAMISDVPGYTWGTISVLAESGVKYFSIGPNGGHRIGYTLSQYGDKPFWWRSPDGRHRILCWIPRTGYWRGFRGEAGLVNLLNNMEAAGHPFDLVQLRHCLGDNAGPGVDLSEFVKQWNEKYAYPRLIIATTSEMMQELERRYGDELPELSGDFTPYWEDGAASSAHETSLNRAAAERLVQAETLFSLLRPEAYPEEAFQQAWRNVVLYDEHTWGAHCSISEPESDFTKAQWAIKQKFALDADAQSSQLLAEAVADGTATDSTVKAINVWNTCSWPRTDIVKLPAHLKIAGPLVKNARGVTMPSQKLSDGSLAFLAADVPALGAGRFTFHAADATARSPKITSGASIEGLTLTAGKLSVTLDKETGAISHLIHDGTEFVKADGDDARLLNDYLYVAGRDPGSPQRNGPATITVQDRGPLLVSVVVTSDAPGCHRLQRTITLTAGLEHVDIVNLVDKKNIYDQEGVHFCFPLNVPEGVIRMDIPWAVAQVEDNLLPGSCKNYFTVQRWVDVANQERGITLATVDAPLMEVGNITCDPVSVGWIKDLEPSQTLYSYVMNNYWETNYKAGQEGPTTFRYALRPHRQYDPVAAQRFGTQCSQPLVAVPVNPDTSPAQPLLQVEGDGVLLTSLKPVANGSEVVARLFNTSSHACQAQLLGPQGTPLQVKTCDLTGHPEGEATSKVTLTPWEIKTVRTRVPRE